MAIAEQEPSTTTTQGALPDGVTAPYDWALDQLRVAKAHAITRGSKQVIVAVIDLGYRFHPDHDGHLWINPQPLRGDVHGWDFAEEDATLEFEGYGAHRAALKGHHSFVVGEVAAVAPDCPIMVLRVGYEAHHKPGWERAVRYAVEHGAKVLVIPHGYHMLDPQTGQSLFYLGTDFGYLADNPGVIEAHDYAYQSGCLIFKGTGDNRGRRVTTVNAAIDSVIAVGSTNRYGPATDIGALADYAEVAAPAGARGTAPAHDRIWGTGADGDYIDISGGCMSAGFAGGVAALVMSRYPYLSNVELRQILRNTARGHDGGRGWGPLLGHGILDAARAVSLGPHELGRRLQIDAPASRVHRHDGRLVADVEVENKGVFDVDRCLAVAFDGDPLTPAVPTATREQPVILRRRQLGHAIAAVPGFERITITIDLGGAVPPPGEVYVQVCALDVGAAGVYDTARIA